MTETIDEQIEQIREDYKDNFRSIRIWRKGNKERIYLDQSYMTRNESDVRGKNWDEVNGWYVQYDRPGHWNILKEIAEKLEIKTLTK